MIDRPPYKIKGGLLDDPDFDPSILGWIPCGPESSPNPWTDFTISVLFFIKRVVSELFRGNTCRYILHYFSVNEGDRSGVFPPS